VREIGQVMKKEMLLRKGLATEHAKLNTRSTAEPPFLQLFNTWRTNEEAARFILHRELGKVASQLLDVPRVRLYQDSLFVKEPGCGPTEWHSDLRMAPFCSNELVTCWIPLQSVKRQEEGGTGLSYASRSHVDFALPFWFGKGFDDFDLDERYIVTDHGEMAIGDASWHHGWTLHAAPPNLTKSTRLALSLSFVADGAPLLPNDAQGRFEVGGEWGLVRVPDTEDSPSYAPWLASASGFISSDDYCPLVYSD